MSEEKADKKSGMQFDGKTVVIAAVVVAVVVVSGLLIYQHNQKKNTVSVSFGDKTISATIKQ